MVRLSVRVAHPKKTPFSYLKGLLELSSVNPYALQERTTPLVITRCKVTAVVADWCVGGARAMIR
jgi:hypothetical protein